MLRSLTALALAAAVVMAVAAPAGAYTAPAQALIDAHLAAYPGGRQISATEISYAGGAFVMGFAPPGQIVQGVPDCPSGWFCFYDRVNFGWPRGKLSDCGWQDLATWGWQNRTESAHYNSASGSVSFTAHGSRADHGDDTTVFTVSVSRRTIADVYPYRNVADHVYRFC